MTTSLHSINTKARSGKLKLDELDLGSKSLVDKLHRAFSRSNLALESVKISTATDDTLQFEAIAERLLGVDRQRIRALFFLAGDQLECLVTATLPEAWTFAYGYPDLPDYVDESDSINQCKPSFFGNIRFASAAIVVFSSVKPERITPNNVLTDFLLGTLSKDDIAQVGEGLNYHGKLDLAQTLPFKNPPWSITKIQGAQPCHGTLMHGKHEDTIELRLPMTTESLKTENGQFAVGLSALVLSTTTSLYAPKPQSGIRFVGHIGATDGQHDAVIFWPVGSLGLIVANERPIPFSDFDALFSAGKESHNALPKLPIGNDNWDALSKLLIGNDNWDALEIREIVLGLQLPLKISRLSCTVGSKANWKSPFIHSELADIFAIEEWLLRLEILPRTELIAELSLRIGGGLVHLSAGIPDLVFSGQLATNQEIDVSKLIASFFSKDTHEDALVPTASKLKVRDLDIEVDFKNSNYLFDLEMATCWQISLGGQAEFQLRDVRLSLQIEHDWNSVSVDCRCTIGGINVELFASRDADTAGASWSFLSRSAPGQDIPFDAVMQDIGNYFGVKPNQSLKSLESFVVRNLQTEFTTGPQGLKTALFHCDGEWSIATSTSEEWRVDLFLTVSHSVIGLDRKTHVEGRLAIDDLVFTVNFDDDKVGLQEADRLIATYSHSGDQYPIRLGDLLATIIDMDLGTLDSIEIDIKDALFAYTKTGQTAAKYLFGVDLGVELDFSHLPLIGKHFSDTSKSGGIGIQNLQMLFASEGFNSTEVAGLNEKLLPLSVTPLPDFTKKEPSKPENGSAPIVLNKGLNVAAELNLGITSQPLAFPTAGVPATGATYSGAQPIPNATVTDNATWLNIQQSIGPVHFERIGFEYRDDRLRVLASASFSAAGLTISLDGLGLDAPLSGFDLNMIKTSLRGMGIDYRNAVVEIGGSFLKMPPSKDKGNGSDENDAYGGSAVIKARGLTISAFGSYTTLENEASLVIYGLLDYPLGGPPFLFVNGLAAGFGYHRNLRVPPLERLALFSLIMAAAGKQAGGTTIEQALSKDASPARGEYFLAAGLMFSSFKLVESTLLLTASFGNRLEFHLLGLSSMRFPPAELGGGLDAVAEVELVLKGSFNPDEGFVELRAQLTPTAYLFAKDCHLTGGFAFLCWFKGRHSVPTTAQDGEFVLTLGGYHPAFHVPAHYPSVPRLGFNWQVIAGTLSLRGDVYFALTPSAVMAGGHLQAEWHSGSVYAWFKAGIDFLIAWQPYHYDASAYIDIGVEVTFELFGTQRLSLDVGADLHIWGPVFAGDATVHLWIISFTIHFGNTQAGKVEAIGWDEFRKSFLPANKAICSIAVTEGLVGKHEENGKDKENGKNEENGKDKEIGRKHLGVINGKHFCLTVNSRIPLRDAEYSLGDEHLPGNLFSKETSTAFGIAPMGIASVTESNLVITIRRTTSNNEIVNNEIVSDDFEYVAIQKNVPAALWGESITPKLHGPQFVENAFCGVEIRAKPPVNGLGTKAIKRDDLLIASEAPQRNCRWGNEGEAFVRDNTINSEGDFQNLLDKSMVKRNELLASLYLDYGKVLGVQRNVALEGITLANLYLAYKNMHAELHIDDSLTYDFLTIPQCEAA